jgi:hypothetical protein
MQACFLKLYRTRVQFALSRRGYSPNCCQWCGLLILSILVDINCVQSKLSVVESGRSWTWHILETFRGKKVNLLKLRHILDNLQRQKTRSSLSDKRNDHRSKCLQNPARSDAWTRRGIYPSMIHHYTVQYDSLVGPVCTCRNEIDIWYGGRIVSSHLLIPARSALPDRHCNSELLQRRDNPNHPSSANVYHQSPSTIACTSCRTAQTLRTSEELPIGNHGLAARDRYIVAHLCVTE